MPSADRITDNRQLTTALQRALSNEWLRAFALALVILLFLHLFIVRFVSVQSTSMFATLRPGDLLLVQRWPKWTGLDRGDIVVFRDPLQDKQARSDRTLMVKRVAAGPGDVIQLKRGHVFVNGQLQLPAKGVTHSWLVRLKADVPPADFFRDAGIPPELLRADRSPLELPLNAALAAELQRDPWVIDAEPMSMSNGARRHLFPFSPRYAWNGDDYGPIKVPKKGDTLRITVDNLPLYDRVISAYEGHRLGADHNTLTLDDAPLTTYVVEQDYYFVLGDSRHFSADSRYWGFLPASEVVGRGSTVIIGGE